MLVDSRNHNYLEVGNIRVTYVPAEDREDNRNWSGFMSYVYKHTEMKKTVLCIKVQNCQLNLQKLL